MADTVSTIYGPMDVARLTRKDGVVENGHERTTWVEYWLHDELVHRSVHVTLKESPMLAVEQTGF